MDSVNIKGQLIQFKNFCLSDLGYDRCTARCIIKDDGYEIELNCDDEFQSRADWRNKVEQVLISETFYWEIGLQTAAKSVWDRLRAVMSREERELRFGLNLVGQSIEAGAGFKTHIGLEFVANMKREQERTMLMLPNRSRPTPHSETTADEDSDDTND